MTKKTMLIFPFFFENMTAMQYAANLWNKVEGTSDRINYAMDFIIP